MSTDAFRPVLLKQLRETWQSREDGSKHWLLIKILQVLRTVR